MALHSAEYPAINSILTDALKKSNMFFISYSETDQVERFAGRSAVSYTHLRWLTIIWEDGIINRRMWSL